MALISIGTFKLKKANGIYQLIQGEDVIDNPNSLNEAIGVLFEKWRKENESLLKNAEKQALEVKVTVTAK